MAVLVLIISVLVGAVLAEIAIRAFGGLWFHSQLHKIGALLQAFRVSVGDDARQALLLRSGRTTLQFSLVLLGLIVGMAAIAVLAPWVLEWTESQQMAYFAASLVVATGWWILRPQQCPSNKFHPPLNMGSNAYGALARWLHWLALEPTAVRHLAFDLERQFALPKHTTPAHDKVAAPADGAVYVCGLARSGTTMLLHILDEIDVFRSLTYRDMPFVLAPNLWKLITQHAPHPAVPAERAHGDDIHVHFDSPEGFEEVFWRTFGTPTTDSRCLGAEEPSTETLAAFADYRALVANPRTEPTPENGRLRRYLSKNNNNVLRLRSLCADPTATVLIVYRNPVATARSLHRQHQRFCATQTADRFTHTYMGWLAHHEFGLDHLPFCFALPEMDNALTPDDPNYWLAYWNAVYRHILAQTDLRLHLVNHDALCAEPVAMLAVLFATLGVEADAIKSAQRINPSDAGNAEGCCPALLQRAAITYRALLDSPKNLFKPTNMAKSA